MQQEYAIAVSIALRDNVRKRIIMNGDAAYQFVGKEGGDSRCVVPSQILTSDPAVIEG
jgi:hypothetical protein